MAEISIHTGVIENNIKKLSAYLNKNNLQWSLIVKILGGHRSTLENILNKETLKNVHSIGDSRISGLKTIKSINPELITMYIKPPAIRHIPEFNLLYD